MNSTDTACCKQCLEPKSHGTSSPEKLSDKSAPRCSDCNEVKNSHQDACPSCNKKEKKVTRVNPVPKSQRDGIAAPRCSDCNEVRKSHQDACPSCNKKEKKVTHVNPVPKSQRDGIDSKEFRIVLIGKTGAGKSATANTLLQEQMFRSRASMNSVTEKCQHVRKERLGHKLMIVDTPGLFDTSMPKEDISTEIRKCITMLAPGPHAFLLVISLRNRFTKEEQDVLKELDDMFGKHMLKYLIVVFTCRDHIENQSLEEYIEESPDELKSILEAAGGGYVTFNNKGKIDEKEEDAKKLFNGMKEMVKKNGGNHFTSEMFDEAENIMQARIERELKEKEQELRREVEQELRKEMETLVRKEREYFQKLHEANVEHMEKMKLELKVERERNFTPARKSEKVLGELVHEEMQRTEKKNKLIQQIANTDGTERVKMQHQLTDVGDDIKQIIAKKKTTEAEVTVERFSTATVLKSQTIREEERTKIEEEEKTALSEIADALKHLGSNYVNLFK